MGKTVCLDPTAGGGAFLRYKCKGGDLCSFEVTACRSQSESRKGYRINTCKLAHNMCSGRSRIAASHLRKMESICALVSSDPNLSGKTIVSQVKTLTGADISLKEAYRGKHLILDDIFGSIEDGFRKLRSLLSLWSSKNPTSITECDWDSNGRFRRAFLGFPYAREYNSYDQNVVGIDGAFIKHGKFKSTQLLLVGRDGNFSNIILGIAVCASESEEDCVWFLRCCKKAGVMLNELDIFSDRGTGILAAFDTLGLINIRFCTRHILQNINKHFKGHCPADMSKVIYQLQAASSPEEFKSHLDCLKMTRPDIAAYIEQIDPVKWVLYPALGKKRLYGWRTTNFVESQNAAALTPRLLLPFGFFSFYMKKFMETAYANKQQAAEWVNQGLSLTHRAHAKLQKQQELSVYYSLRPSSDNIAFVENLRGYPVRSRRVDICARTCNCNDFDQQGIPCRHYIAALDHFNKSDTVFEAVDECFKTEAFQKLHGVDASGPIELVLDEDMSINTEDLPPVLSLKPGRNKQRRYPSGGDPTRSVGRAKRKATCSKCGREGHNKRTCGN